MPSSGVTWPVWSCGTSHASPGTSSQPTSASSRGNVRLRARASSHLRRSTTPRDRSDRLLLGLQGLLAGWDRSTMTERLAHHRRVKQARGTNINGAVPPGYEKVRDGPRGSPDHGKLVVTSDVEVQGRVALILRKGLELGGVLAVVRWLLAQGLTVPAWRGESESIRYGRDGKARLVTTGRRT